MRRINSFFILLSDYSIKARQFSKAELLLLITVMCLFFVGCSDNPNMPISEANDSYNVIVIAITNVAANHLTTYGYFRNTSPNIDSFAQESIVFDDFFSPASWTLPTGISLFTSLYPYSHGVTTRYADQTKGIKTHLNDSINTLIDVMKENGYYTIGLTGGFDYSPDFGLTSRFDYYSDYGNSPVTNLIDAESIQDKKFGSIVEVMPKALEVLRGIGNKNFFMFLQGYDSHCPFNPASTYDRMFLNASFPNLTINENYCYRGYEDNETYFVLSPNPINDQAGKKFSPAILSQNDMHYMEAQYDAKIRYVDDNVGNFLKQLKKIGVYNRSIIILLSEHGEMFSKHGRFGRAGTIRGTLYNDVIHVPLIIHLPSVGHARITALAQLVDIMPTILDLLNIKITDTMQGKSLKLAIFNSTTVNNEVFGGSEYGNLDFRYFEYRTINEYVRNNQYKLIHEIVYPGNMSIIENYELYAVLSDKEEEYNLIDNKTAEANLLKQDLNNWKHKIGANVSW